MWQPCLNHVTQTTGTVQDVLNDLHINFTDATNLLHVHCLAVISRCLNQNVFVFSMKTFDIGRVKFVRERTLTFVKPETTHDNDAAPSEISIWEQLRHSLVVADEVDVDAVPAHRLDIRWPNCTSFVVFYPQQIPLLHDVVFRPHTHKTLHCKSGTSHVLWNR